MTTWSESCVHVDPTDPTLETLVGYVTEGGCGNPACHEAIADGRAFHATPTGSVVLETYHFATRDDAEAALRASFTPDVAARHVALHRSLGHLD